MELIGQWWPQSVSLQPLHSIQAGYFVLTCLGSFMEPSLPFVKNWSNQFSSAGRDEQKGLFPGLVMLLPKGDLHSAEGQVSSAWYFLTCESLVFQPYHCPKAGVLGLWYVFPFVVQNSFSLKEKKP